MNSKTYLLGILVLSSTLAFATGDEDRITTPLRSELPNAETVIVTVQKAKSGDAAAQNNLGDMFLTGSGFAVDCTRAFYWFHAAAQKGLPAAQFNLGNMYLNGRSVAPSIKEATKWYHKAAEQDFPAAMNQMGAITE